MEATRQKDNGVRPYIKGRHRVTVLPMHSGKSLYLIKSTRPHRIVLQIRGIRGGLHGTINVDKEGLAEALRLAGIVQ